MSKKSLAESINVLSPCSEDWNAMVGNEKTRFCSHCASSVNNLSQMSRREAMRLVKKSNGRICVRYIQNPVTKAPLFSDKLYQISRRTGIAAGVLGASLAFAGATFAQGGISIGRIVNQDAVASKSDVSKDDEKPRPKAAISGTVVDSNGAFIPGASVNISGNGIDRTVTTSDFGSYLISNVPSGVFDLSVSGHGFNSNEFEVPAVDGKETIANATLIVAEEFITTGMMVIDVEYENPLHRAVSNENLEEVSKLIANGADVNADDKNFEGTTALFLAVERGNIEIAELLLRFGAKVNVRNSENRTPLLALDYDSTPELVRLLLTYNSKISDVDDEGNNILHIAAENDSPEIINLLLREGAELDSVNVEGQTALMIAAYYENYETVQALLEAGAKVNIRDNDDQTALSIAKGEEGEEIEKIIEILIQYGARD